MFWNKLFILQFNIKVFERDLLKDIESDVSGYFGRVLRSLVSCGRSESEQVDYVFAKKEAQELYDVKSF